MSADSFYRDRGDGRYESTPATAGPWSPETQHAGPPSALLGHAISRHKPREGFRVARITLEIPRPVPVGELAVSVEVRHATARTELVDAELTSAGRTVMLARAWRIPTSPEDTPTVRHVPPPPPIPTTARGIGAGAVHADGYLAAMDWRFMDGGAFEHPGPGAAWVRQRIPLLPDVEDTPLTRALALADSSWAIGSELDYLRQLVINTDITVALHREPVGEWLCLRSETVATPGGSAIATGQLDDTTGDLGRIVQTLFVAAR